MLKAKATGPGKVVKQAEVVGLDGFMGRPGKDSDVWNIRRCWDLRRCRCRMDIIDGGEATGGGVIDDAQQGKLVFMWGQLVDR